MWGTAWSMTLFYKKYICDKNNFSIRGNSWEINRSLISNYYKFLQKTFLKRMIPRWKKEKDSRLVDYLHLSSNYSISEESTLRWPITHSCRSACLNDNNQNIVNCTLICICHKKVQTLNTSYWFMIINYGNRAYNYSPLERDHCPMFNAILCTYISIVWNNIIISKCPK